MALFAALFATWPAAEVVRLGSWTLRRGDGGGARVSAATLDGSAGGIGEAEAAMRRWGQRPRFMMRPGDDALDATLAARGHAVEDPSLILAAPAAALALAVPDEAAIDCAGALARMAEIWAAGGVGAPRLAVMARAAGPKTWLLGRQGDRAAACAFVAVHGDVAMLHALEVAPEARRRGVGALLTRASATWAHQRGMATLALAVTEANAPARALYGRLGFAEAARYHYRVAAQGDGPAA